MNEEEYAALLMKLNDLEARVEALSHHGMDHGNNDALDNGILLREIKLVPTAKQDAATIYLQDNGGKSRLMILFQTGAAVQIDTEA
jgi:hypothetical protein